MLIRSPQELAILVYSRRKKLKLTQKELGDRVGLKQKTISAIENNPENIKLSTLFKISAALEIDITSLPKNEAGKAKSRWSEEW